MVKMIVGFFRRHIHGYLHIDTQLAPCPDGMHTQFLVMICRCGRMQLFPAENFRLTTPEYQSAFQAYIKAEGFYLDGHIETEIPDAAQSRYSSHVHPDRPERRSRTVH